MTKEPTPWLLGGTSYSPVIPENAYAFVYWIRNIETGRGYIGKKLLWFKSFKQVKGKRKRILKESDWKTYTGSNEELNAEITKLGKNSFSFRILKFCASKGEASYYEAKLQLEHDVLLHPDKFYNAFVGCKIHRKHVFRPPS